ncbi:zinc finger protein [Babesia caballi]|uniref:Zinc finger protein n=1 Tax=Babesia caballi TaxID=5871 RepID=A0AAV4M271_BABCB|nr:zinc finger protein [Babesia caballi]
MRLLRASRQRTPGRRPSPGPWHEDRRPHADARDELDFEFQPLAQKGSVTTVEGYLLRVAASLDEHVRSIAEALMEDPDLSIQLTTGEVKQAGEYIHTLTSLRERLMNYTDGFEPFTLMLDDPSGNSYVEFSDAVDITTEKYTRTEEQLKTMGYAVKDDFKKELDLTAPLDEATDVGQEGLSIAADCPNCGCEGLNKICEVLVPGFGPCVIMAFTCDTCGAKSNEIKPGGGYKDRAKRWTLNVNHASDLNRDVIISETAAVRIPHLDLEMSPGTIGAVFTTVEGLLGKLVESLEKAYPFLLGDSAPEDHARLRETVGRLRELASGELPQPFALVVDDPADHSFVGARASHAGEDCDLTAESYERTASQNEELGLTDMKTENY